MNNNKIIKYIYKSITEKVHKNSSNDGTTSSPKTMMDALQDTLWGAAQMRRCVMGNVGATGSPHSCVSDTWNTTTVHVIYSVPPLWNENIVCLQVFTNKIQNNRM